MAMGATEPSSAERHEALTRAEIEASFRSYGHIAILRSLRFVLAGGVGSAIVILFFSLLDRKLQSPATLTTAAIGLPLVLIGFAQQHWVTPPTRRRALISRCLTAAAPTVGIALTPLWAPGVAIDHVAGAEPWLFAMAIALSGFLFDRVVARVVAVWCCVQYAALFWLFRPRITEVDAPEGLLAIIFGVGPFAVKIVTLLMMGWAVSGMADLARMIVLRLVEEERRKEAIARENDRVKHAQALAEEASRKKSEFLAHLNHELRTPLNAILGYTQILLRQKDLDAEQKRSLCAIAESGRHVSGLVEDILDTAKIEAGKLDLAPQPVRLGDLCRTVLDLCAVRAKVKRLHLSHRIAPEANLRVIVDPNRIRQVLLNLTSNAINATSEGSVHIVVSKAPEGDALRFEVHDTGPGIRPEDAARIFEPFEQLGSAQARSQGTGLGLGICKKLVLLMGGRMDVRSQPGEGSVFWFELPLLAADPEAEQEAQKALSSGSAGAVSVTPHPTPPRDTLQAWRDQATLGNLLAVEEHARVIAESEPLFAPFAERVRTLACEMDDSGLIELLNASLAAAPSDKVDP